MSAAILEADPGQSSKKLAMSEAAPLRDIIEPDLTHLVTEDDEPVDNQFSEKQQRLLTRPLYLAWSGKRFVAMANVGLFYATAEPPLVPDLLLSLDVDQPQDPEPKANRSYFLWRYGKPPDLVVEIVSNREGGEDTTKLEAYARMRVTYYLIFDPFQQLGQRILRGYRLVEGRYVSMIDPTWLEEVGLGLAVWEGEFEKLTARWLRWTDRNKVILPLGQEQAEQERQRAEQERQRADRMARKLSELGVDLDSLED